MLILRGWHVLTSCSTRVFTLTSFHFPSNMITFLVLVGGRWRRRFCALPRLALALRWLLLRLSYFQYYIPANAIIISEYSFLFSSSWKCNFLVTPSVCWLVCLLPCFYRSTCFSHTLTTGAADEPPSSGLSPSRRSRRLRFRSLRSRERDRDLRIDSLYMQSLSLLLMIAFGFY